LIAVLLFLFNYYNVNDLYTPRFGNAFLRARHLPFKIASQERDEWLTCMLLAMRDLNYSEATQDSLLNGLFGTADWMRNSPG
jgi:hemoglobin